MNAAEIAGRHGLTLVPTGSRFVCDPPVMDTDIDYAVYITPTKLAKVVQSLRAGGWDEGGSIAGDGQGDGWCAYRRADENLILFHDKEPYDAYVAATTIAKALNLRNKEDRVTLFVLMERLWPRPDLAFGL